MSKKKELKKLRKQVEALSSAVTEALGNVEEEVVDEDTFGETVEANDTVNEAAAELAASVAEQLGFTDGDAPEGVRIQQGQGQCPIFMVDFNALPPFINVPQELKDNGGVAVIVAASPPTEAVAP